jgi:hypothetical protein
MFNNVLRDAELVDFARDAVAPLHAYIEEAAAILAVGRPVRGRRRQFLVGALRHATRPHIRVATGRAGMTPRLEVAGASDERPQPAVPPCGGAGSALVPTTFHAASPGCAGAGSGRASRLARSAS